MGKIIFVTGTDTGVGKTLVTALLLEHLRWSGVRALAVKPFCSGGRGDVELFQALQKGELSEAEANPFYFSEPVAPLVAARKLRRRISLGEVLKRIRAVAAKCDCLLVEGSGGLLVPLGEGYTVADLIARLRCVVIVVARNRLGTINHTLLTVRSLPAKAGNRIKVVLSNQGTTDISARTNEKVLSEILSSIAVIRLSSLGENVLRPLAVKKSAKKLKKVLARVLAFPILNPVLWNTPRRRAVRKNG